MMHLKHSKEFTFSKSLLLNRASALLMDLLSAIPALERMFFILVLFSGKPRHCGKTKVCAKMC